MGAELGFPESTLIFRTDYKVTERRRKILLLDPFNWYICSLLHYYIFVGFSNDFWWEEDHWMLYCREYYTGK